MSSPSYTDSQNPGQNKDDTIQVTTGDRLRRQQDKLWGLQAAGNLLGLRLNNPTRPVTAAAACHMDSHSPFVAPKKSVCCAGFDHWREVLSLYSTRQVRFAVPPSVTVRFWTRGY